MEFSILGPLEVQDDGRVLAVPVGKQRALLGILLLHPNEVVSADRLIEELWGGEPPATAQNTLQVYVSQLRKALGGRDGEPRLVTRSPGYELRVDPDEIDARRFDRLATSGRDALGRGDFEAASALLTEALSLWRGPALADFAFAEFAQAEISRLEELRLAAVEDRIEADLQLGRHADLVAELETLRAEQPLRERLRGQLMVALYRSGRQAEALEEYRIARRALVDELGIEPGPELQALERAILRQEPELEPPSRIPVAGLRRLPIPPTPLLGRETELAEATALARRADIRLLTFTGPGGIGKTRLALELAHELAGDFADGVVFADLSAISDAALVGPTVARSLGLVGGGGQTAGEALEQHLQRRSLLIVLDNFEQVAPAAPLVAVLLSAAPGLKLLATSRELLRVPGEHEFPVPPLSLDPSVALFVQRAEAVDRSFRLTDESLAAVGEICRRLEGLPLAIELAAARSKLLDPVEMVARLGSRLDFLTVGPRTAPARQQTLRTTIDWSYELLEAEERTLFARLAVFVGGWTLEAAEAVGGDGGAVLDGVESLLNQSLVGRRGEGDRRFAMLDSIREYAVERLAESGEEEAVRGRHLQHFLALAERAEPELHGTHQREWFERLEVEHDNLRAALASAVEQDAEAALRLGAALRRFWQIHGHLREGRRWLEAALERAAGAQPLSRAKALNGAGILAGEQGDFDAARGFFEESLGLARELGEQDRIAASLVNLGNLALFQDDYEQAGELYEESVVLYRKVGNLAAAASGIENLGSVALAQGDLDRALALLEESVSLAREAEHAHNLASALCPLGRVLLDRGETQRARTVLAEALSLSLEVGQRHGTAECLEGLGGVAGASGDPGRAALLFGAADALRQSFGALRAPDVRPWYERTRGGIEAQLDAEEFEAAYERGRGLPLEEAVELASAA